MKKTLLFVFALFLLHSAVSQAQVCERDSNLLNTGQLLSPAPHTPDSPFYNLATAYINIPYQQSITVYPPDNFSGFAIDSVSIPLTGGVSNLPVGMSYTCDPPSCVFLPLTLGCIRLQGTPAMSNMTPDTLDLGITATVYTPLIDIPVTFPGQIAPGSHYYLILLPQSSGSIEAHPAIADLKVVPNPVSNKQAVLQINALEAGEYQLDLFNVMGQQVHQKNFQVNAGLNEVSLELAHLPTGTYMFSLGNLRGRTTGRLIVR